MSIDWDALVLAPVMAVFGEGDPAIDASLPLYTPRGLPAFRLPHAVFDAEYMQVEVNDADGSQTTTHCPVLGVRTSLFSRPPAQSDTVLIPSVGKLYLVRDVQADGHGHAKLMLMEAAT